ncbi:MAG: GNAT family N-acetyltransferase [Verrucomicrobiales bacterium]|nr:GNAT family N-acetyltransferase [Verrucomicrobiales bacterium]MCP5527690.1 GNAT family N-acetyltransferase [Verrucomicrobiales bacterium]
MNPIEYRRDAPLDIDQARELYRTSTLGERRPIDDRSRFEAMLRHANLVITAWDGDLLVGIARSLTDFAHSTYLADLAVRVSHQHRGIGRELVRLTQVHGGPAMIVLIAAPKAQAYYPKLGFQAEPRAWTRRPPAEPA